MIIPVRCFTCGKIVGNKWEAYLGPAASSTPRVRARPAAGLRGPGRGGFQPARPGRRDGGLGPGARARTGAPGLRRVSRPAGPGAAGEGPGLRGGFPSLRGPGRLVGTRPKGRVSLRGSERHTGPGLRGGFPACGARGGWWGTRPKGSFYLRGSERGHGGPGIAGARGRVSGGPACGVGVSGGRRGSRLEGLGS